MQFEEKNNYRSGELFEFFVHVELRGGKSKLFSSSVLSMHFRSASRTFPDIFSTISDNPFQILRKTLY